MKRLLVILLTVAISLTFSVGNAFAAEDNNNDIDNTAETQKTIEVEKVKDVDAKAISSSEIKVTWDRVKNADGYKVYRYNSKTDSYKVVKTVKSGKTTTYVNKKLKSQTKKTYKVQAFVKDDGKKIIGKKSKKASAVTKKSGLDKLMGKAESKLGCSYVSGSAGPNAFDCSGFVYYVFKNSGATKVKFSRSSAQGIYSSIKKYSIGTTDLSKAKKGDILFYGTSKSNIWHTGIYYGNGKQIHAYSTKGKVAVTSVKCSTQNKKLVAIVRLPLK